MFSKLSIPGSIVRRYAGKRWLNFGIQDALSVIDDRLSGTKEKRSFSVDSSDLKLILQGKIFEGWQIIEINSRIDSGALILIQHTVRARTLNFVIKLEKQVPEIAKVAVG